MRMTADGIDTRKPEWFKKALSKAQSGDVDYQYGVGSLYAGGLGVPRDPSAAFRWFERAARSDYGAAQTAIGAAYAKGEGVETDYIEAKAWLEKEPEIRMKMAAVDAVRVIIVNIIQGSVDYGKFESADGMIVMVPCIINSDGNPVDEMIDKIRKSIQYD